MAYIDFDLIGMHKSTDADEYKFDLIGVFNDLIDKTYKRPATIKYNITTQDLADKNNCIAIYTSFNYTYTRIRNIFSIGLIIENQNDIKNSYDLVQEKIRLLKNINSAHEEKVLHISIIYLLESRSHFKDSSQLISDPNYIIYKANNYYIYMYQLFYIKLVREKSKKIIKTYNESIKHINTVPSYLELIKIYTNINILDISNYYIGSIHDKFNTFLEKYINTINDFLKIDSNLSIKTNEPYLFYNINDQLFTRDLERFYRYIGMLNKSDLDIYIYIYRIFQD